MSETVNKEFAGTVFVMKEIAPLTALSYINRMDREGIMNENLIKDVIVKGCGIGSTLMTEEKINKIFKRQVQDMIKLYVEILKYNNLFPEEEGPEGNEEGSEE